MMNARNPSRGGAAIAGLALVCAVVGGCSERGGVALAAPAPASAELSVFAVEPHTKQWDRRIAASGSVLPWQELTIDAEIGGLPVEQVEVEVGERVRKGQLLARMDAASTRGDMAQQQAALAEAQANDEQARSTLAGAQGLAASGSISGQQLAQAQTQAKVSAARLAAARAQLAAVQLQLRRTAIVAPDDGVISARLVTPGTVLNVGTHLFRMIRQQRLEWHAEVDGRDLAHVQSGQSVRIQRGDGTSVTGTVRQVAPLIDSTTLTGIVFVDLPADGGIAAGSFVSGSIGIGHGQALAVPQAALVARDGFQYVMKIGADHRVHLTKVTLGQQQGGEAEVRAGLAGTDRIVAAGAGLLHDGDLVNVLATPPQSSHTDTGETS
ncbi:efflux RND transporter periplasmic adaptor subunit [Paraburkholderia jirisanensis]